MEILIAGAIIGVLIMVGLFTRGLIREILCTEKQWEDLFKGDNNRRPWS